MSLIASILISLILAASTSLVFNQTILNPEYLQHKAEKIGLAKDLATIIPAQFAKSTGNKKEAEQIQTVLTQVLTPGYIQGKIDDFSKQLKSHLNRNGPVPQLDLHDLALKAREAGLDVPEDQFNQAFTIPPQLDTQLKTFVKTERKGQNYTLVAIGILGAILVLFSIKRREYGSLLYVLVSIAVFEFSLFYTLKLLPDYLFRQINLTSLQVQDLAPVIEKLVRSVLVDVEAKFIWLGIIFAVISLLIFALSIISRLRHTPQKSAS